MPVEQRLKKCIPFLMCLAMTLSTKGAALELLPEAHVDLQGVFLKQLIKPSTDIAGEIQLAPAPAWGETRVLNRIQFAELLSKAIPSAKFDLAGANEIKITRRSEKLQDSQLLQMLTEKLNPGRDASRGDLEMELMREWKPISIPVEPVEMRILDKPNYGLSQNVMVKFQLTSGEETIGTFTVFLKARLFRNVWVARTLVPRGKSLDQADLVQERRDVINIREPLWTEPALDPSLQVVQPIPAGGLVYARAVQHRPVVRRGDFVQAVAADGLLSVSIRVEALEDGAPDQIIRARNLRTRKELRGKVVNEETIQVVF